MSTKNYVFRSKVMVYPGVSGWRFLGIPERQGKEIKKMHGARAKGWGSLPVSVTVGKTQWDTSIFPDKKSGSYLLPLKISVRKAENIFDTDVVSCAIRFR